MSLVKNNPYQEIIKVKDLEKFAPPYTPETFTDEEKKYLKPFFSNFDKPVFIVKNLPEEVIGALSAKYSRATESMRRTFIKEYVSPIINPESQKNWTELTDEEKKEELVKKKAFEDYVNFVNENGGIDEVANIQRGRNFFDKWLVEFGDDSISEMGNIHICIEGLSIIATKEIEDQRIGISPIEKSTRYVDFSDKLPDGNYRYMVPGEIKGTVNEKPYKVAMDALFDTYSSLIGPYSDYIKELYPIGEDETDVSFEKSRKAKTFDDIRDLLPFSTITNLGLSGSGRAYEYMINRMADHPLGEMRYWAYAIAGELHMITPSFIRRVATPSGESVQKYKKDVRYLADTFSNKLFEKQNQHKKVIGAKLLQYSKDGEIDVLSAFVFRGNNSPSLDGVREKITSLSKKERHKMFDKIFAARFQGNENPRREEVRFRKIPRAFENSHYSFELWARGGDYRDLHRHRMLTQDRQPYSTRWGYDLEGEVLESKFASKIKTVLKLAAPVYEMLAKDNPDLAQYVVPFAYVQHWYMDLTAREMFYMAELRTGPQGRPHYRMIVQKMMKQVLKVHPDMFAGAMVDWDDYSLARRESEKRIQRKKKELGV